MSKTLQSSMSEAMRLTNEGRLAEATAAHTTRPRRHPCPWWIRRRRVGPKVQSRRPAKP
jgi:hypothetical protein